MIAGMHHIALKRLAIGVLMLCPMLAIHAQSVDKAMKDKADALFDRGEYASAYPLYSQLISLSPQDHDLNFRFGATTLFGGDDKSKAIGYLKYAVQGPSTNSLAWYFLGRAYQLDYQFDAAVESYQHFKGTADKKVLAKFPVDAMEQQCRNGKYLLSNIKDIEVLNKVEVASSDFFRFYDLSDIGGKIVVTPEELLTSLDRKNGAQSLVYLPTNGGPIYFSSYGKDGRTGKDIYRSELLPTGGFSTPVKLAGYINTDQDEDYAVMAPDGKTFYFCSKGHNSMGGYDVFKSSYDKGMDTFSAPENMDFAVNTPADELLYIVGPDGKQACFASDRDSKQGLVNVYRVGTRQAPVNITIFKGTYASAFDPTDRKAHIVVEDGQSRERVADVKTDINGNYLLALPHGGTYKFLVEGGPNGLAHFQDVEVPVNDNPKVYRQEIQLVNQGGEQLVIKNYYDQPLDADVMALAMDEIKRRAKLDVTGSKNMPEPVPAVAEANPLQAAGFDGTQTLPQVMDLAKKNASGLNIQAASQANEANTAYALAVQNITNAEQESARAKELVKTAEGKGETDKANLLRQAAEAKQRSHEANERARAAWRTAQGLEAARMGTQQRAAMADKVATAITAADQAKDHAALTAALKELKAALDKEKGPERTVDEVERTRRAATEAAAEATRKLNSANAQRDDETQLRDRVNRLARDMETAKGGRKQDLARQHGELEAQLNALHDEVEEAFAKARSEEAGAALARGQAGLVGYLSEAPGNKQPDVAKEVIAGLEQRVAAVRAGNAALEIDPQYAPVSTMSVQELERRTFDWKAYEPMAAVPRQATQTGSQPGNAPGRAEVNAAKDASGNAGAGNPIASTTDKDLLANAAKGASKPDSGAVTTNAGAGGNAATMPNAPTNAPTTDQVVDPALVNKQPAEPINGGGAQGRSNPNNADSIAEASGQTQVAMEGNPKPQAGNDSASGVFAGPETVAQTNAKGNGEGGQPGNRDQANASDVASPTDRSAANAGELNKGAVGESGVASGNGTVSQPGQEPGKEEQAFLLSNKLAELEQLRQGEKDRKTRDSLDTAIKQQRDLIATFNAGGAGVEPTRPVAAETTKPVEYKPLEYDQSQLNELLAEEAYPGFALRRKAIAEGPESAIDKANMLHALEMDLIDSIDARMAGRVTALDSKPEGADSILTELDQWRQLKALHVQQAADDLAAVDQTYAAGETKALEDAQLAGNTASKAPLRAEGQSLSPHNDSYVTIDPDLEKVYLSVMQPRSKKDGEAIAAKDQDIAKAAIVQAEVDSMEQVLAGMPAGKPYDKLRERTDRKIDDLLIAKVDLGQRMAFISRSEYDAARDSAAVLEKSLSKKGLPPDEPMMQMVKSFKGSAQTAMNQAKEMRKEADRSEDALKRNSLYSQAYATELGALRDMDRSLTVSNWLLSGKAVAGEALSYEDVEARMFPEAMAAKVKGSEGDGANARHTNDKAAPGAAVDAEGTLRDTAGVSRTAQPEVSASAPATPAGVHETTVVPPVAVHAIGKEMADSARLAGFLDKYYYLTPEERNRVMGGSEERKYFLMKGSAMEKLGDAETARADAAGSTDLANNLKAEATAMRTSEGSTDPSIQDKASMLEVRADGLFHRSDSLMAMAKRLQQMAGTDDAQAAALMQSMPDERSAAIMGLEQGKRRTEPLLARTRPATNTGSSQSDHALEHAASADTASVAVAEQKVGRNVPMVEIPMPVQVDRVDVTEPSVGTAPKPFTGPLTADVFAISPSPSPRSEPIAIDAPMPEGVVYKVQVGAFRNALPMDAFSDMTPVTGEHAGNGLVRYTAGMFTSAESASQASAKVRARGYRDAFVAAYINGKRVPLRHAMQQEAKLAAIPGGVAVGTQIVTQESVNVPAVAPAVPTVQLPQPAATQAVLQNYPASADAVLAEFKPAADATAYYNDPTAAPAKQVEVVKGLFFTVQVGVYSKPTPLDKLFNITPLNSERTPNDKIRYTTGIFLDEGRAVARKGNTVALGVKDAFVTAYLNGKRIPVRDARALLGKFGRSVLVDPALATP